MSIALDFNFLVVLNLLIVVLWPATGNYSATRNNAINVIMLILTVIAVVFDIVYLVIRLVR